MFPMVPLLLRQALALLQEKSPIQELFSTRPLLPRQARKPLHELIPTLPVKPSQARSPTQEPSPIRVAVPCACAPSEVKAPSASVEATSKAAPKNWRRSITHLTDPRPPAT